ncbi:tRNA (5-methylaminomethyl-2-thiouridine)(34)-methyltransferase MnmD [Neolewinella litorea]|uniref:Methyltransferase n=1 Tax=Neolewinella litorea TaxID=2562452 RepID=A0A4S4NV04_9BACT|nr:tRNA (5-methylaminomethyl-2-thiouridine)(34)-methyltransferase MnmD [Neolewinella litorea]THH40070.1 methyltransferase [Neolewinella litorea]
MEQSELLTTDDGSHSLRSARFGVNYHSTHGALRESHHVFMQAGLSDWLNSPKAGSTVRILELGFGTGLNALLARETARHHPDISFVYTTYERYPISEDLVGQLNYPEVLGIGRDRFDEIHTAAWEVEVPLEPNFVLLKRRADFLTDDRGAVHDDLIFYDAFAPENQPELWTVEAMRRCARRLRPGGVLVTYCAKGQFKRNLRAAGFRVEALPGPPGKREMTRAHLIDLA